MLLSAVIICCIIIASAEPPLNSYSLTGDNNGYDYNNIVTNNGYLGSKDNYQNGGSFYGAGDTTSHKLSNHISGHSLVNAGNQDGVGSDIGNSYNNGYSANDHGNEYAGYSNTYDNSDSDSYTSPTRTTSTSFKGYSNSNVNGESALFNAYSSGSVHKDSDFGQHAISSSGSGKRIPVYSGYFRPSVLENYSEDSAGDLQGYHDSSASTSYSEIDHAYAASYPQGGLTSEYLFGKQKDGPYNIKSGDKYSDIYAIPSEMRYTRGNTAHLSHNRDVPLYMSGSGPSGHFSKIRGSGIYTAGKPSKYGYKYFSRYAPNSGVMTYLSRGRDGYSVPYGKGNGKVIVIKDGRPSYGHMYSDEPLYTGSNGGYRSKSGGFTPSNYDGYSVSGRSYDDSPISLKRYRVNRPMLLQRTMYP